MYALSNSVTTLQYIILSINKHIYLQSNIYLLHVCIHNQVTLHIHWKYKQRSGRRKKLFVMLSEERITEFEKSDYCTNQWKCLFTTTDMILDGGMIGAELGPETQNAGVAFSNAR